MVVDARFLLRVTGIGHFQDVTLRLVAERLLSDAAGITFIDGELSTQKLSAPRLPSKDHTFHVYCSELSPGGSALLRELASHLGIMMMHSLPELGDMKDNKILVVTNDVQHLEECEHMLLYLTSQTWTRCGASDALAEEARRAMDAGIHLLLAHESERASKF